MGATCMADDSDRVQSGSCVRTVLVVGFENQ